MTRTDSIAGKAAGRWFPRSTRAGQSTESTRIQPTAHEPLSQNAHLAEEILESGAARVLGQVAVHSHDPQTAKAQEVFAEWLAEPEAPQFRDVASVVLNDAVGVLLAASTHAATAEASIAAVELAGAAARAGVLLQSAEMSYLRWNKHSYSAELAQ